MLNTLKKAILAGSAIGLAGFAYLAVGGFFGSLLFSFGLLTVYLYKLSLFTGVSGRFEVSGKGWRDLAIILLGNIVGAAIVAMLARLSPMPIQDAAASTLSSRLGIGWWKAGCLAIGCGFIVEEAVFAYKKDGKLAPTFFGVSVFVLCGFPHCVADAFYYALAPTQLLSQNLTTILGIYASIVAGNFLGCNLRRLLKLA